MQPGSAAESSGRKGFTVATTYRVYNGRQIDLSEWTAGEREKGAREAQGEGGFKYCALRPFVKAENRILVWSSTHYIRRIERTSGTLREVTLKSDLAVLAGLEIETRKTYGAGIKAFAAFCDENNIPEDERVPASEDLLCSFAAVVSLRKTSRSTLNSWMAGLRAWQLAQAAQWNIRDSDRFDMIRKAVSKNAPQGSARPQRPPVTLAHLVALAEELDERNSKDVAVKAAACVAFWACVRLGELLVKRAGTAFDPTRLVAQDVELEVQTTRESNRPFVSFKIPWTKTTKIEGETIVLVPGAVGDKTCPVEALMWHKKVNASEASHERPFFGFRASTEEGWSALTKEEFMERCNEVWMGRGLGRLTGHSFRIGGTTELLLQGVNPDVVKQRGRWKSDAFLLYWRKVNLIVPEFLMSGYSEEEAEQLRRRMADWVESNGEN